MAMINRRMRLFGVAVALSFACETILIPGMADEAFAFGFGGGHGGGFGGHMGGFGGHMGGFGGHMGGLGGHFGGFHGFGHFGGMHFGARHFGGMHFGARHFGGMHFGAGRFGGRHFGAGHFGHMHLGAGRFGGRHFGTAHFGHGTLAHGAFGHTFGNGAFARHGLGAAGTAFAHTHLAGLASAHFQGFHGLDPHGFNRNGFGGMAGWNHWAANNWGAGWNYWGSGWGYWSGPVFWPFFYGDMLTFALWPNLWPYDFYDPFFFYGPDYLLSSIFWPGPFFGTYYPGYDVYYAGYVPFFDVYDYPPEATNYYAYYHHHRRHHHYRHHRHHYVAAATNAANETCGGLAPGVDDLPIKKIMRVTKASYEQMALLDKLQAASTKADAVLRAACPTQIPLTPVGRLEAVSMRLHAMLQAIDILRPALIAFDQSLDPDQRQRLAHMNARAERKHAVNAINAPAQNLAELCRQQAGSFTNLPVQRINDIVKPTDKQGKPFDQLKAASAKAAQELQSSCPSTMPDTASDRLDAVVKRIDAMLAAVRTVKPSLTTFYASLSDEQKARFNVIGSTASAAPQQSTREN